MSNERKSHHLECSEEEWEMLAYILSISLLDSEDMRHNDDKITAKDIEALDEGIVLLKSILSRMAPLDTPFLRLEETEGYPLFNTFPPKVH